MSIRSFIYILATFKEVVQTNLTTGLLSASGSSSNVIGMFVR